MTNIKMKILFPIVIFLLFFYLGFITNTSEASNTISYQLSWPGMLPDNRLYKIKVLRNKIIEKMLISPVKRVEFDLLMADKTIYASKLLLDKGEIELAKETALKGENYYSQLVQNYNKSLLEKKLIPGDLDKKITLAALKHQEVFKDLEKKVSGKDREAFVAAENFSHRNYQLIIGFRSSHNAK